MEIDKVSDKERITIQEVGDSGASADHDKNVQVIPAKTGHQSEEDERNSESEHGLGKPENKSSKSKNSFRGNQGKTLYPRTRMPSKEFRELSRKHALLEKNLKIEGMPDPPQKFRKRRSSISAMGGRTYDKELPYKRKRLASVDVRPRKDHMPKWELMGGDAQDPLNLNGLAHSEEGRLLNMKTPESSPLPTPDFRKVVYVKVPPNIQDPLNLEGTHDQREIDRLLKAPIKKRHRPKKKPHLEASQQQQQQQQQSQEAMESKPADNDQIQPISPKETKSLSAPVESASQPEGQIKEEIPSTSGEIKEIVKKPETQGPPKDQSTKNIAPESAVPKKSANLHSTMSPEAGIPKKAGPVSGKRSRSRSLSMSPERRFKRQISGQGTNKSRGEPKVEPMKFPEKPIFTMGNYNRYYGYRNRGRPDPRLHFFNPVWFKGKDVLDIGCNTGNITLAIAEQFHPNKILGMDIDGKLIQAARQNIRHMLSQRRKDSAKFPNVFEMSRGPLEAHPLMGASAQFPNNVLFLQGNYVPGGEELLAVQKEEYDTILALSITKWIHLNNGDMGLKLFFQRIFRQLRPGGRLVLEPQPFTTYKKRAKLAPNLFEAYKGIKLKPEGFKHYLLSIGFVKCEVIGIPVVKAKGFRRPLLLFTKPEKHTVPPSVTEGEEEIDYRNICQECGSTDKTLCDHPQYAGVRRGPYAEYLYDHVNYYPANSDSPYFSTSQQRVHSRPPSFHVDDSSGAWNWQPSWSRVDSQHSLMDMGENSAMLDVSRDSGSWFGSGSGMMRRASIDSSNDRAGGSRPNSNIGSGNQSPKSSVTSVSRSEHGSEWSYTSRSASGSSSSRSTGSRTTDSSSGSYYSPEPNGARLPNGDIAHEHDGDQNGQNYINYNGGYVLNEPAVNGIPGEMAQDMEENGQNGIPNPEQPDNDVNNQNHQAGNVMQNPDPNHGAAPAVPHHIPGANGGAHEAHEPAAVVMEGHGADGVHNSDGDNDDGAAAQDDYDIVVGAVVGEEQANNNAIDDRGG